MQSSTIETSLSTEAKKRYLNYALSVITARALPDVRDGLKPVQRRILFTMRREGLTPDAKHRKSAKIVGDVMGSYHPHGDSAIYEAMVRMAQSWVMRAALVDGKGNFGSPDGDGAAAYRYTEARLRPIAIELLSELDKNTVSWRPNYDGTRKEPVVLPARFPHLLVNGSQGIAVGMATSIPPHNLNEVIDACVAQIDAGDQPLTTKQLIKYIKGPDFPTGGQLHASKEDIFQVYDTGSGSLKLRGDYKIEEKKAGGQSIVITSVPYAIERGSLVEKIADIIISKKLPALVDVRDESTDVVRVVLEFKRNTDPQLIMAYLYKHTSLQTNVSANLTCLVPSPSLKDEKTGEEILVPPTPERLSLGKFIQHFLDFRFETLTRRIQFDLELLQRRIHILEGFAIVFDSLDEAIKIIRKSEGKADASAKLSKRFSLSTEQCDAILELRLYRLAKLEILEIQKELAAKRKDAKALQNLLKSDGPRWELIKTELTEIKSKYGERRATKIVGSIDEPEFAAEDFIIDEDAHVILTHQGWIKRQREVKDISTTRTREGDAVLAVVAGSTRSSVAFFSNFGSCYVTRINDITSTSGYGDPVQKLFKLADGEKMITALSFDPRSLDVPVPGEGDPLPPYAIAITRAGQSLRFSLSSHREPSTKAGRRYARLAPEDEVIFIVPVGEKDGVMVASSDGHALGVPVSELSLLSGAGRGSMIIKLQGKSTVIGACIALSANDTMAVETETGKVLELSYGKIAGHRADVGHLVLKRVKFARVITPEPTIPSLESN
jgi:DNA gyrase subunit A